MLGSMSYGDASLLTVYSLMQWIFIIFGLIAVLGIFFLVRSYFFSNNSIDKRVSRDTGAILLLAAIFPLITNAIMRFDWFAN